MARTVAWTESAWLDLEAAGRYIARDSPTYAASFLLAVTQCAASLDELSERGRILPEVAEPSIRELQVQRYRLVYQVAPGTVYILALIHGARDFERAWSDRPRDPR